MQTVSIRSLTIKDYLLMPYQSINAESHDTMKTKTHQLENFVSIYVKQTSQSVCVVLIDK
jgi:hypothetical protein